MRDARSGQRRGGTRDGIDDDARYELTHAAAVNVAQLASQRLASPPPQGAIAQADAAQAQTQHKHQAHAHGDADGGGSRKDSGAKRGGGDGAGSEADGSRSDPSSRGSAGTNVAWESAGARAGSSPHGAARGAAQPEAGASSDGTPGVARQVGQVGIASGNKASHGPGGLAGSPGASPAPAQGTASVSEGTTMVGGVGSAGAPSTRQKAFKGLMDQAMPARRATEQQQATRSVAQGLRMLVRDGGGEVVLRLRPGELGAVTAKLSIRDARVDATLRASTSVARDLLVNSVDELRTALEARGLTVDGIAVVLDRPEDLALGQQARGQLAGTEAGGASASERAVGDRATADVSSSAPTKEPALDQASQDAPTSRSDGQGTGERGNAHPREGGRDRALGFLGPHDSNSPDEVAIEASAWAMDELRGRVGDGLEWVA